jgi:enamine deaminase RidA (YjgF/YER057c/UK114 family)
MRHRLQAVNMFVALGYPVRHSLAAEAGRCKCGCGEIAAIRVFLCRDGAARPILAGGTNAGQENRIMAGQVESRLAGMGIALPEPKAPLAKYVPFVRSGKLVFVSGQVPFGADGSPEGLIRGKLTAADHCGGDAPAPGSQMALAAEAARRCAVNLIVQAKAAAGDLDRVARVVKLTGFVNCDGSFAEQHLVINAASNLFGEVFGEAGAHSRSAVGSSSLPMGAMVEIEAIFEIA